MRAQVAGLGIAAIALALYLVDFGPRLERPEVEPDLDAVTVVLKMAPAGPAQLEVTGAGVEPRRLESRQPATEHRFRLEHLQRGAWIEAQGVSGSRRGPALAFAYAPLGPEQVVVEEGPRGLVVRLKVARPLACALLVHTRTGIARVGSDEPATEHEITLSDERMPFTPDIHVRLTGGGGQVVEERLPWNDAARRAWLLCAATWLCGQAETLVPSAFTGGGPAPTSLFDQMSSALTDISKGASATARAGVDARLKAIAEALPPERFLEQLGGGGGVLDRTDLPVALRARFDAAIHQLEILDAALAIRSLPGRYPYYRLYGARVGPSFTTRLGTARSIPLLPEGQDTSRDYLLVPDNAVSRQTLKFNEGLPKTFLLRTVAHLGTPSPGRLAEIQAVLDLREGTFVDILVNGRPAARIARPAKFAPHSGPLAYYTGFDANLLKEGANTIEFRCRGMPAVIENLEFDHGVIVHPPGFTLRLKS